MRSSDQPHAAAHAVSRAIDRVEEVALVILLGAIVLVSLVDVIVRNVGAPLSHVQQILPNVFVWLVWLGVPYGIRKAEHFRVKLIPARARASVVKPLFYGGAILAMVFFALLVWLGSSVVLMDMRFDNTTPLGFPAAFVDVAVPVGALLSIVRLAQLLAHGPESGEAQ
jgi:TRAP-type C4-dicarboxylate transport system permease small subunit